jgi:glyoxylase-like metal-dependent hydrolase (beta-lactamase superfamily II)/8-oxo-dGTP pyrophosphatase MutT (NUDIX family)
VSHAYPGIPPAPPPASPLVATAIVLWRDGPGGREVVLVRRGAERRFAGGFHAFPGGRLDPEDALVPVPGARGEDAALVACATRELFEETGVLLARGAGAVSAADRSADRKALLDGTLTWADLLARRGLVLDPALLAPGGRWITPEHLPLRYDARLFLVAMPAGETVEIWPGELSGGGFCRVADALACWERGALLFFPPNLHAVRALAVPGVPSAVALQPPAGGWRIEFQQGFFQCALRSPTLPPASHTNAWVVPVTGGVAVVDPGAPEPADQAPLLALLEALAADGRPLREVWITHCHADHVGAAAAVAARFGVPVRAHALARGRVPGAEVVPFREGDLAGGRFLVLETPGHAREHLAFLDEVTGALLCGDLVSTLSTIVIDPPEGDMAEYEAQLARMRALAPRTLYPAHGPPAPDAVSRLAAYLAHRREREALIVDALAGGGTLAEITARAYPDVPPMVHPVAARSCLAALEKLVRRGRARAAADRFVLT